MAGSDDRSLAGRLLGGVVNPIVDSVDLDAVLDDVDVNEVVQRIDVDELLEQIDVDALLDRIDPDRLLDRVDVERLLGRIDVDALLERVDVDALISRVDVDALISRVDVNEIIERTEIGDIITRSTSGVFTQLLDTVRIQIVTVDQVAQGAGSLVVRRQRAGVPAGPHLDAQPTPEERPSAAERAVLVQGRYAGSVSRFLAYLIDLGLIGALYALGALLATAAVQVVLGKEVVVDETRWLIVVSYALWAFAYFSTSLAATGRTVGKAILGVMVVRADGTHLSGRRAMLRTAVFPLSFVILGIGLLIGLFRRDRRELHDLIADTAVLYAWDADTAKRRNVALAQVESIT
jgi:uncharacterized RDD family membrane protein YckC